MRTLLWAVPSRERPERLGEMLEEGLRLSAAETDFAVGIDSDDHSGYEELARRLDAGDRVKWVRGGRDTMTGWTNELVRRFEGQYEMFGSMGDDHLPGTYGWDHWLAMAVERSGGGFAYPNDMLQGKALATAWAVSARVTRALGWLCQPDLAHYWVDNVVMTLGAATRLTYLEDVIVRHRHPAAGLATTDRTYSSAHLQHWDSDAAAYARWFAGKREADIKTVQAALL